MFNNAQHLYIMKTSKITIRLLAALALIASLSACSSISSVPGDDVYYSAKNNPEPQSRPQQVVAVPEEDAVVKQADSDKFDYSANYESNVAATPAGEVDADSETGDYQFIDDYYESDYAARIKRFNGTGSSSDYYDEEYVSQDCYDCNSGSNWSFSMGVGVGMGMGYSMSYGWPYSYSYWNYPYYGWGYPSWGYPYYGWGWPYYGGGYWAGYNQGYWNGYYDGYYGGGYYPYYGDYYNDYGRRGVTYRQRGRGAGGTTIPDRSGRAGTSNPSGTDRERTRETVVAGSGATMAARADQGVVAGSGRSGEDIRNREQQQSSDGRTGTATRERANESSRTQDLKKPASADRRATTNPQDRTTEKRYNKPKSYESLPQRQPRSSREYVRPEQSTTTTRQNNRNSTTTQPAASDTRSRERESSTYNRSSRPAPTVSQPSRSNSTRSSGSTTRPATSTRSTSPAKTYSSPTRSQGTSSRSYSAPAPTRSSSTSTSSPSRSSSSSSGSSSSSSRSGGGRR